MDTPITRAEHEEFVRRIDDENSRQNRRIELLEETIKRIDLLTTSVEKLATNMENMLREQREQGQRLEVLESRDGESWRKVTGYVVTSIVGLVIGYIFTKFGM